MISKEKRLHRLFDQSGNITILPVDHGITLGPIKGLEHFEENIKPLLPHINSIVLQKGMIKSYYDMLCLKDLGVIMHISGNTYLSKQENRKVMTGSVEEAVSLGCDGVSVHINIGNQYDGDMIEDFARISAECDKNGMPLLAMMYARGEAIDNEKDIDKIKLVARVAQEIGADMVKVHYSGSKESFSEIVSSCRIPVIMAGGEVVDNQTLYRNIDDAMAAGAKGVAIGRNVFQSDNSIEILNCIKNIVHNRTLITDVIRDNGKSSATRKYHYHAS